MKEKLESSVREPTVGRVLQRVEREVSFGFCFQEDVEALGAFSLWMPGGGGRCSLTLRPSSLLQVVGCRLYPALAGAGGVEGSLECVIQFIVTRRHQRQPNEVPLDSLLQSRLPPRS